jgi:hypothetical protein
MTHSDADRERFLETLAVTPFINHACKKVGIDRSTIYEWMDSDPAFKARVQRALGSGRKNLVEIAEVTLVGKIKEGDLNATKFFLTHNSKRYRSHPAVRKMEMQDDETPLWDGRVTVTRQTAEIVERMRQSELDIKNRNQDLGGPIG